MRTPAPSPSTRPIALPLAHEHGWATQSSHATSLGTVTYVRCDDCGAQRVDLQRLHDEPPAAMSRAVRIRNDATRRRRRS
jgi:hypothetical protein